MTFYPAANIRACFFTRNDGVSQGDFASLNISLSGGDEETHVQENRQKVAEMMGGRLCLVSQTHSSLCIDAANAPQQADALVTDQAGLVLGVLGADCTPVLFYDADRRIIAAAHAGWRGAHAGILENTIHAMQERGAGHITALIGPCIGQDSYEVSQTFKDEFPAADHILFRRGDRDGHFLFDLPGYCQRRLEACGISVNMDHWQDTYTNPDLFFSHRRMVHENRTCEGRQISCIALT